ncbi:proton-coupled amino acid transporter-like protein CG1139 isoform X2 [Aphis gossypii]|nr:proton-coupled amino acid transporter-like protein CG1139 isoform X2 [Aphis gossypii]
MPYSFKQVGVVTGLLLSFIAGFTFTYSFTLLCRFRYKICQIHRVPTVSYQNMIEYGLEHGPKAIRCLSMFFRFTFIAMNLMLNFGKSCLYTKFASLAIQELFTEIGFDVNILDVSLSYEVVCLSFLLLPYTEHMKPVYVLSRIVCTVSLCITFYIIFKSNIHIDSQMLMCGNWTDVFQFFGTFLFSIIPVVQVLKIEDRLIKPENFVRPFNLLNLSMAVMINTYIVIGLCAYLDHEEVPIVIGNSVSVFKIIPAIRSRTIIKSCVAANIIFFHRELCLESVFLWSPSMSVTKIKSDKKMPFTTYLSPPFLAGLLAVSKILYTFCSFLVTTAVPSPATRSFQAIMALIGYLGNACNMLVYPYAVELCVTYALHGMSARPYVIAKDMCFVLIGLLVFACGTYAVTARLIGDAD